MREIKFRAWNKWKKEIDSWQEMMKRDLENVFYGLYYDKEHIMQYTGLKDKNGVEIYEGDIVKMHYFFENHHPNTFGVFENEKTVTGVVEISPLGVYTKTNEEHGIYFWLEYLRDPEEELEVIGNIYEDKELLK